MAKIKTKTSQEESAEAVGIGMKTMKMNSEVENFYRFIFENKLRREAHTLMGVVLEQIRGKDKRKRKTKKLQ